MQKNSQVFEARKELKVLQERMASQAVLYHAEQAGCEGREKDARKATSAALAAALATSRQDLVECVRPHLEVAYADVCQHQLVHGAGIFSLVKQGVLPSEAESSRLDETSEDLNTTAGAVATSERVVHTLAARLCRSDAYTCAEERDRVWVALLANRQRCAEILQSQLDGQLQRAERKRSLERRSVDEATETATSCVSMSAAVVDERADALLQEAERSLTPLRSATQLALQTVLSCLRAEQAKEEQFLPRLEELTRSAEACVARCAQDLARETPSDDAEGTRARLQEERVRLRRLQRIEAKRVQVCESAPRIEALRAKIVVLEDEQIDLHATLTKAKRRGGTSQVGKDDSCRRDARRHKGLSPFARALLPPSPALCPGTGLQDSG